MHVKALKPSKKHKTPDTLKKYEEKRSFDRTPEPPPMVAIGEGNAFVVHRHHATRLHYDLRLEQDGTLKSWAVPKGLPPRPGIIRLAVATQRTILWSTSILRERSPKDSTEAGTCGYMPAGSMQ